MWRALARKELRQLLPWLVTLLLVEQALFGLSLAFETPDEMVWADMASIFDVTSAKVRSGMLLVWALIFAYAGFPREQDEQTLPFLFSLPVSRARLFITKAAVAGAILSASVLLGEFERWLVQIPNNTSFEGHTFRLDWALASAFCTLVVAWVCLGYSLFLSMFRRLGLLLCALSWTLLVWLEQVHPPSHVLDPLGLLHFQFAGSSAVLPWWPLAGHVLAATACASIAGWVWVGPTERWASGLSRTMSSSSAKWTFGVGVLAAVVLVGWLAVESASGTAPEFGTLQELEAPEATRETARYRFRYRSLLDTRLERLASRADSVHDRLSAQLAAPLPAQKILVNLLKVSTSHAGSATWEAIRMDLRSTYSDEQLLRTLAHETSHVVALRASDRRIQSNAFRFFDEGLAEYLSQQFAPDPAIVRKLRLEAVLAQTRLRIGFSELVDFRGFAERFSEASVYPLGFTWVEALVATCGEDAPRRLLKALARDEGARDATGESTVRALLQSVNCELDQVTSRWGRELATLATEARDELSRVPTLVGGALSRGEDGEVIIRAELEGPALEGAAYRLLARARPDAGIEDEILVSGELEPNGTLEFSVGESFVKQGALNFQFGISWLSGGVAVEHYQEWRQSRLPD